MINFKYKYNLRIWALHFLMLSIISYPLLGLQFIPASDLPQHLMNVKIWYERINGEYSNLFTFNYSPTYKIWYYLALLVYTLLQNNLYYFGSICSLLIPWTAYICSFSALKALTGFNSALTFIFSAYIALFSYSYSLGFGLMSYCLSIPISVLTAALLINYLIKGGNKNLFLFLILSVISHLTHSISILNLGIFSPFFVLPIILLNYLISWRRLLLISFVWPISTYLVHKMTFYGHANINTFPHKNTEIFTSIFHSYSEALDFIQKSYHRFYWTPFYLKNENNTYRIFLSEPIIVFGIATIISVLIIGISIVLKKNVSYSKSHNKFKLGIGFLLSTISLGISYVFLNPDLIRLSGPGLWWYHVRVTSYIAPLLFTLLFASVLFLLQIYSNKFINILFISTFIFLLVIKSFTLRQQCVDFNMTAKAKLYNTQNKINKKLYQRINYFKHFKFYECLYLNNCNDIKTSFMYRSNTNIFPLKRLTKQD